MRYWELVEEKDKRLGVVFTFGRFNPPTVGHKINFQYVRDLADKLGYDHIIYVSPKQDFTADENGIPKGPLTFEERVNYLQSLYPQFVFNTNPALYGPYKVLEDLVDKYQNIKFAVGEDRFDDFAAMPKYAAEAGVNLELLGSGPRTQGVSGTDARFYAVNGKKTAFYKLLGNKGPGAQQLFDLIRERAHLVKIPRVRTKKS